MLEQGGGENLERLKRGVFLVKSDSQLLEAVLFELEAPKRAKFVVETRR